MGIVATGFRGRGMTRTVIALNAVETDLENLIHSRTASLSTDMRPQTIVFNLLPYRGSKFSHFKNSDNIY